MSMIIEISRSSASSSLLLRNRSRLFETINSDFVQYQYQPYTYLNFIGQMRIINDERGGIVLHHLSDGLLVDVVAFLVDVSAKEVFKPVLDFSAWREHRHPFLKRERRFINS